MTDRFWKKVGAPTDTGCWPWLAGKQRGYGRFMGSDKRVHRAHRIAYELLRGPIPAGLVIDHLCRNRGCVNPAHMEPVTHVENVMRGVAPPALNGTKTHCPSGHPYDSVNTYQPPGGTHRLCRECGRSHRAAYKKRTDAQRANRAENAN